ncbi:MAG: hypothetical protein C0504_15075 [Candidatus Solibacter sp.]|nr:hypothetical protein [Candidatus Solibacter sp.]
MSIAILIGVHDGIVLAADSASTLTLLPSGNLPDQQSPVPLMVYNNANKIANLLKGEPVGCVAYGSGSIGNASISTLLKDFRLKISAGQEPGFSFDGYSMQVVAELLTQFLVAHIDQLPPNAPKPSLGILVGGYSKGRSLGEGWMVQIENGSARTPQLLRKEHEVGITWGGEAEAISRLVVGFGQPLPAILSSVVAAQQPDTVARLMEMVKVNLQAPIVFSPMPIQDAIDLAEFLVHTAIMYSRFTPGLQTVGGPIEIAAITKHEGFKWIQRKHYYNSEFNRGDANEN